MAFLVALASSSLTSGISIDVSVTFLFALVHLQCGLWKKCVRMRKNRIFTTTTNTKKFPNLLGSLPTPSKNPGYATVVPLYSEWKVGTSASVCRVTLCVYCWVHFGTIAKMYGNLFSGRPSKVLPWSWLKSLGLGLGTRSLGLGLGLDKKVLFTSLCNSYWRRQI